MNYNPACSAWVTNPSLILRANTEAAEQDTWIYTEQQEVMKMKQNKNMHYEHSSMSDC